MNATPSAAQSERQTLASGRTAGPQLRETAPPVLAPNNFQQRLRRHAAAAAGWIVRSIEACNGSGSSAYYSRWYKPGRGWAPAYPETTGYIIETLFNYAKFAGQPQFADVALKQADWVITLQYPDGALPGGWVAAGRKDKPSIFNTGQMIFGLVAAYDHSNEARYLDSARAAARWLARGVDAESGIWSAHAYVAGYAPAYYTRVCWPMLEVWQRTQDDEIRTAALRVLQTIARWQLPNGAVKNWGFKPNAPAFTHTIAYTMRGFLESGRVLGGEGAPFDEAAVRMAEPLRRRLELRGKLAGSYDLEFRGNYWYACLTGNCQLALNWQRIYERYGDARFLSAALKSLEIVLAKQRMRSLDPNVRGAIAGSSPFCGRYLTLRYPNWAAKFFLDAALHAYANLDRLREHGPCASP